MGAESDMLAYVVFCFFWLVSITDYWTPLKEMEDQHLCEGEVNTRLRMDDLHVYKDHPLTICCAIVVIFFFLIVPQIFYAYNDALLSFCNVTFERDQDDDESQSED